MGEEGGERAVILHVGAVTPNEGVPRFLEAFQAVLDGWKKDWAAWAGGGTPEARRAGAAGGTAELPRSVPWGPKAGPAPPPAAAAAAALPWAGAPPTLLLVLKGLGGLYGNGASEASCTMRRRWRKGRGPVGERRSPSRSHLSTCRRRRSAPPPCLATRARLRR